MSDSVALVVLDTLRKDAFDEHFDWLPGLSFERALSPSHWTTPVHGSLFAGAYPTETGVHAHNPTLDCTQDTLAEKLSRNGWTCRGFSANGNVSPSTDFDRGFDEFTAKGYHSDADVFDWKAFVEERQGPSRYPRALWACLTGDCDTVPSLRRGVRMKYNDARYGGPPNLTAADVNEFVADTDFGDREFLFLNLMEAHDSYDPPDKYQTVEPPEVDSVSALAALLDPDRSIDSERYRQAYHDSVRYLAEKYRDIHDALTEDFDYIVTISDHGEAFGEEGIYGHVPSLIPDIVHVPLSIWGRNVDTGTSDAAVNLLDVHRTITDIAGVEGPPRGRNLLHADQRPTMTEAHGISEWQRESLQTRGITSSALEPVKRQRRGIGTEGYYGYESLEDDWVDACGEAANPKAVLDDIVASLETAQTQTDGVTGDVRRQLSDMGYL